MAESLNFWESLSPEEQDTIDESQWGNDQLMFSSDVVITLDKET